MIYVTGDTHGSFERIGQFCERFKTTHSDILVILGDAGINYYGPERDKEKKEYLKSLPVTIFAIQGNHEQRPCHIATYEEVVWNDGVVFYEKTYPNILFAKDGEVYDLNGKKTIVIGGAYSVDKDLRIMRGWYWWEDEQPTPEIRKYVEEQLNKYNWEVDIVLSHTVPIAFEPVDTFLRGIDQSKVDKTTEMWLGGIENKLMYKKWYAGHFHISRRVGKLRFMFNDYVEL